MEKTFKKLYEEIKYHRKENIDFRAEYWIGRIIELLAEKENKNNK